MSHTISIPIWGIWLSDSIFKPTSYMVDDFPKKYWLKQIIYYCDMPRPEPEKPLICTGIQFLHCP